MYKELIDKLKETSEAIAALQGQLDGEIEDFDGLHPETEKVIAEFMATESLIAKLDKLTTAWKTQHPTTPSIPLVWRIEDGLLFLDDVFIAPLYLIEEIDPTDFCHYTIGIPCKDGRIEIVIASRGDRPYRIERVERELKEG